MKNTALLLVLALASHLVNAQDLKSSKDSLSYAYGVLLGQNLKKQGVTELDYAAFLKAFESTLAGKGATMEPVTANKIVTDFTAKQKEIMNKKRIAEGTAFLESNAKRQGVTVLPSGLQYEVLTTGTGSKPKATDQVKVHYTGTLIDGTVFDSSVQRGQPATFPVNGVIQGWVEALQLMPAGSKWKLFIPYNLAYGERGAGAQIGPFSTLIFEVELLSIETK